MSDIDNYAESNMENICLITSENMDYFAPFILSNAKTLILANEPVVAFGYVFEGTACGAICGYIEKSHFEIISLYVAPDYRRRGVATALMTALSDMLSDFAGVISVDFVITNEEHNLLACMLEKYGFRRLPDVTRGIYRTTIERIFDSDLFERYNGEEPFTPFAYISREKLTEAEQQATARDLPVPEDGFLASSVDMNCSFIHIIKNELKAYVVVEKNSDGSLLVSGVATA